MLNKEGAGIDEKAEAERLVHEQYLQHKGKWLTLEDALVYRKKAQRITEDRGFCAGKLKELAHELMEEYGVLEIEAINILQGYHIMDYVNKYYRIKNRIPLKVNEQNQSGN